MPSLPKRPPFFAAPLLALLFLAAAPAAHAQKTLEAAFALSGSLTPITAVNLASAAPDADGDRAFTVDLIAKAGATSVGSILLNVHHNMADIEAVALKNILRAPFAPFSDIFRSNKPAVVGGVSYDQSYSWGWADGRPPGIRGFTAGKWKRLMTVTFHYQADAGDATLDIVQAVGGAAETFRGARLTVQGPPE